MNYLVSLIQLIIKMKCFNFENQERKLSEMTNILNNSINIVMANYDIFNINIFRLISIIEETIVNRHIETNLNLHLEKEAVICSNVVNLIMGNKKGSIKGNVFEKEISDLHSKVDQVAFYMYSNIIFDFFSTYVLRKILFNMYCLKIFQCYSLLDPIRRNLLKCKFDYHLNCLSLLNYNVYNSLNNINMLMISEFEKCKEMIRFVMIFCVKIIEYIDLNAKHCLEKYKDTLIINEKFKKIKELIDEEREFLKDFN
ncbi:hypothetical protein HERIO_1636 [Hepatospora eriocheir]|uniref:Uncharacterized protein n=1 Tax=Hepatospora eriocheir TaxID=1081669 RepID=A0A1X0Q9Q7_9MICR|nr:hypothetical protein HERIO_1636 [Hepatospora eriocheir]